MRSHNLSGWYLSDVGHPWQHAYKEVLIMFGSFRRYFATDLAIDLGTANTLIVARDKVAGTAQRGAR